MESILDKTLCTERPNTLPLELLQVESLQSAIQPTLQNCKCMDSTASLLGLETFAINAETKQQPMGQSVATECASLRTGGENCGKQAC